ncbi:MAG: N-acetylmuramoyl-L-alanine amidase [Clostridia bacterium]|nr:N-acetylmuramoyl-L-alanine amidase [Clostridia bacterium]
MIVLKRKSIFIFSVLIVSVLTFIFCFGAINKLSVGEASVSGIKIVLDAGHGGIDSGVSGVLTGVKESEINLSIVKKLEKYIVEGGMTAVLTRNSEAGLYGVATKNRKKKDMKKRKEIINDCKPALVVSVHLNKYSSPSVRGAQVFYKKGDENGKILAELIQNSFNNMEENVRKCKAHTGDYYILNCSQYPSVIAECGFLSNKDDEALLIKEEYQDKIAYTIFCGIINYLSEMSYLNNDK